MRARACAFRPSARRCLPPPPSLYALKPHPAVQPVTFESAEPELVGYTREAHTEIEALFPVLPNPQLLLYVYPHLGEDGAPVPGYATAFPLYERVEYALPGEVP